MTKAQDNTGRILEGVGLSRTRNLDCCELSCERAADFVIIENRQDIHPADGETHACTKHVGDLLGTPEGRTSDTESWVVWPIVGKALS